MPRPRRGRWPYRVVPFPTPFGPMDEEGFEPSQPEFGPFTSTQIHLRALVEERYHNQIGSHKALVAILRMFLALLPDARYDGPCKYERPST
ncbi:hypothetical protein OH76DRAFT_1401315 [Lentinus brumalis]|uniref:Uncharacterized protein n=1 Tax=Lentinus brumalis TaxID=2498619 RepID=A0A371DG17_9APHY|nr:hypothetical protein OH76DRAFT_1401315 [Polyporus brumalis]